MKEPRDEATRIEENRNKKLSASQLYVDLTWIVYKNPTLTDHNKISCKRYGSWQLFSLAFASRLPFSSTRLTSKGSPDMSLDL